MEIRGHPDILIFFLCRIDLGVKSGWLGIKCVLTLLLFICLFCLLLFLVFHISSIFTCISVLPGLYYVYVRILDLGVTDSCEQCGCWDLNPGPLEEQSVLLAA